MLNLKEQKIVYTYTNFYKYGNDYRIRSTVSTNALYMSYSDSHSGYAILNISYSMRPDPAFCSFANLRNFEFDGVFDMSRAMLLHISCAHAPLNWRSES